MRVPHRYTSPADRAMYNAMIVNMPIFLLMYIFSYLDRVNVAFAKQVLQHDIGLSNQAFALGAGIFFIGYVAFDVPSNIAMYYIGARRWLARIMITWGLVSASFAFVTTDTMFYFLRFLLGVAEAGLFPAVVYFLTLWFSVRWRGTILGLFYMGMPLSMVIGGPISGFLLDMDGLLGGFHGWQLMFLMEGIFVLSRGRGY